MGNKGERGAVAAEFALVGGLIVLLTFSLLDLGLLLNTKLVLMQAARSGLRQAVIDGGASPGTRKALSDQLQIGGIDPAEVQVSITPRSASYGTWITVALSHEHRLKTPLARVADRGLVRLGVRLMGRSENLGGEN